MRWLLRWFVGSRVRFIPPQSSLFVRRCPPMSTCKMGCLQHACFPKPLCILDIATPTTSSPKRLTPEHNTKHRASAQKPCEIIKEKLAQNSSLKTTTLHRNNHKLRCRNPAQCSSHKTQFCAEPPQTQDSESRRKTQVSKS